MKDIDLAEVLISPRTYRAWKELAAASARLSLIYDASPVSIPDERGRVHDDGRLSIYVPFASVEISMTIPASDWSWRAGKN